MGVQWFRSFAQQLVAGGRDCLYTLKLPKHDDRGTHTETQTLACISHFGLRGQDRPVRALRHACLQPLLGLAAM